jgi:hypothetical protein
MTISRYWWKVATKVACEIHEDGSVAEKEFVAQLDQAFPLRRWLMSEALYPPSFSRFLPGSGLLFSDGVGLKEYQRARSFRCREVGSGVSR